jgi:hypothetical protein
MGNSSRPLGDRLRRKIRLHLVVSVGLDMLIEIQSCVFALFLLRVMEWS